MRKWLWLISSLFWTVAAEAHHIIGGEMSYRSEGHDGNTYVYRVFLKLYRGCEPIDRNHAALDGLITLTVYNNDNGQIATMIENLPLTGPDLSSKQRNDPCIVNPPQICYQVGTYQGRVRLALNRTGYTVVYQRCCRSDLLLNVNTQGSVGATFFAVIPGTENGVPGDNSPVFSNEEAVLICSKGRVDYTYAATDDDGDELRYSFVTGYRGGEGDNNQPIPALAPPYPELTFRTGFAATHPLGPDVTIDPVTGEISGRTNLTEGSYDITVCVSSYRNGKLIGQHYKDFQFEVHDCHRVVLADIPTLFNDCKGSTISFPNNSTPGKTYRWDFGDGQTSTEYTPTHTFTDTGVYHVTIQVDPDLSCGDSMGADVHIFPGFEARFDYAGSCLQFPTAFRDRSVKNQFDKITGWQWSFGTGDAAQDQNPAYQYTRTGVFPVSLTVSTEKGCEQTVSQTLNIYDKPPLSVSPPDTILCYLNSLQLSASSTLPGSFQWSPAYQISNTRSARPVVSPQEDTTYQVTFTDNQGCVNTASVRLRVKDTLLISAGVDTTICAGDPLPLQGSADDPYAFRWYDQGGALLSEGLQTTVTPDQSQAYRLEATLGSCLSNDTLFARLVPYPQARAAPDTSICYGDAILLQGSGGAYYRWTPATGLSDSTLRTPRAQPLDTTSYVLSVTDTLGCPKPASDTITVAVVPPVQAYAGQDTIITLGHSFQLHATGGTDYTWSPATGLSDPFIPDPVVSGDQDELYALRVATPEGCLGYDSIYVRYIKGPDLYVPNAFTPNGDGQNDVFRPIPVGITRISSFRVYNRWGELVFETKDYMKGWDGRFRGKPAGLGTYVWVVQGVDFNNKPIEKKGAVTLIR